MDFKKEIEENLGIYDLKSYGEYKEKIKKEGVTIEEVELLSPDNISSREFWKWAANSYFTKDTISFGATPKTSISSINAMSYDIGMVYGALPKVMACLRQQRRDIKILEIGPGFGGFRSVVQQFNEYDDKLIEYCGVDIYPRIEGENIYEIEDGDTKFPEEISSQMFDVVYSSNVFQHLTVRQRISYFEQIKKVMAPGGFFSFTDCAWWDGQDKGFRCKDNDKKYMVHYGQFVEFLHVEDLGNLVRENFYVSSFTQCFDLHGVGFVCEKW